MGSDSRRNGNPFWELEALRKSLPDIKAPENWQPLSYFINVSDKSLLQKTCGKFPANKTMDSLSDSANHPLFLLKREGNFSYRFCPCSTKNFRGYSQIPVGSRLEPDGKIFQPSGYICHHYLINLPPENNMVRQENFFGIVRESDIVGEQYKEGMR